MRVCEIIVGQDIRGKWKHCGGNSSWGRRSLLWNLQALLDSLHALAHTHNAYTHEHILTCRIIFLPDKAHMQAPNNGFESKQYELHTQNCTSGHLGWLMTVCAFVRVCDSPLPTRRPAKMRTRVAHSSPLPQVCWTGRRSDLSGFPLDLRSCRTPGGDASPSHRSPGTGRSGETGNVQQN